MYPNPGEPSLDCYYHLDFWIKFQIKHHHYQTPKPDDPVFPSFNTSTGKINRDKSITPGVVAAQLKVFTAVLSNGTVIKQYTTHCFRRGGAQYWFIFAPIESRWNLRQVQWWGGWAEGEQSVRFRVHSLKE